MRRPLIPALVGLAVLTGCREREQPAPPAGSTPQRAHVLVFVPKVPGSVVVDTTGTADAERITLVVPVGGDSVARFYRVELAKTKWQIPGDRTAGAITDLYAAKPDAGLSLWIHIEYQDPRSARYTMITHYSRPAPAAAAH